jgi:cytochrome b561
MKNVDNIAGGQSGSSTRSSFDAMTIAFHWTTALLVALLLVTGFATRYAGDAATLATLLIVHRSLGVSVAAITAMRLGWRLTFAFLPPFPAHLPKVQQRAAKMTEYVLYALLLAQPATGLADTLFRGQAFALFGWTVPALLPRIPSAFKLLHAMHAYAAIGLSTIVGLHAGAALLHHFVLGDEVLRRMVLGKGRMALRRRARESGV